MPCWSRGSCRRDGPASRHLQWFVYFPFVPEAGKVSGELITSVRPI